MNRPLVILGTKVLMAILLMTAPGCQFGTNETTPSFAAFTSTLEPDTQKTTLEEARSILGVTVPAPTYLPRGHEIKEVYIELNTKEPTRSEVILLISDEDIEMELVTHTDAAGTRQRYEFQCPMLMVVRWFVDGGIPVRLPVEQVKINEKSGFLVEKDDHNSLLWNLWNPGQRGSFELILAASKSISRDELANIAESVPTPTDMPYNPTRPIETKISPEKSIVVPQGHTGTVTVRAISQSIEPLEVLISLGKELPQGVEVKFHPEAFSLKPSEAVDVEFTLTVSPAAPPPQWPRRPPPKGSPFDIDTAITEYPYYSIGICFNWSFPVHVYAEKGEKRPICTSMKLRFEEPPPLPPGMVTLKEAHDAVEFPISVQLPSYMPEGTEPPFIGLTVTNEEPHGVTVHYSTFQVTIVPQPGVTGPPPDATGEWVTIRKTPVLVGDNRVDWWRYDLHYSIISEQVPAEEQLIVAESMMLVAPQTGSWLEQN